MGPSRKIASIPSPVTAPSRRRSVPLISVACGGNPAYASSPSMMPSEPEISNAGRSRSGSVEIDARLAGAERRLQPREVRSELPRDQRRALEERQHLIQRPDRLRLQRQHGRTHVCDAGADVGRAVAQDASGAARRKARVHELERAVQLLGRGPIPDEREHALLDVGRRAELAFAAVERKRAKRPDEREPPRRAHGRLGWRCRATRRGPAASWERGDSVSRPWRRTRRSRS